MFNIYIKINEYKQSKECPKKHTRMTKQQISLDQILSDALIGRILFYINNNEKRRRKKEVKECANLPFPIHKILMQTKN